MGLFKKKEENQLDPGTLQPQIDVPVNPVVIENPEKEESTEIKTPTDEQNSSENVVEMNKAILDELKTLSTSFDGLQSRLDKIEKRHKSDIEELNEQNPRVVMPNNRYKGYYDFDYQIGKYQTEKINDRRQEIFDIINYLTK